MNKKCITRNSHTDWEQLDKMNDRDIDLSDVPEISPEMFGKAIARKGLKPIERKTQITLRIDSDVLNWFRNQERGYQTRINIVLRAYMKEKRKSEQGAAPDHFSAPLQSGR